MSSAQASTRASIPSASVSGSGSTPTPASTSMATSTMTTPSTPLRPIRSASGFEYPAIWSFPPFFTLQPNPSTQSHQLDLWRSLFLRWARHERVFEVNVDAAGPSTAASGFGNALGASAGAGAGAEVVSGVGSGPAGNGGHGVFENTVIKRRLLPPAQKRLFQELVKNGEAAPDPPKQDSRYLVYWRKPDEWGDLIYTWVTENGLNSSIMTFYEITDGDLSHTTEFYELPTPLLRKALESLVKRGKAQLLEGKGEIGQGVRFL